MTILNAEGGSSVQTPCDIECIALGFVDDEFLVRLIG